MQILKYWKFKEYVVEPRVDVWSWSKQYLESHCVKSVRVWSFSSPYFPTFGLNTERYEISILSVYRIFFNFFFWIFTKTWCNVFGGVWKFVVLFNLLHAFHKIISKKTLWDGSTFVTQASNIFIQDRHWTFFPCTSNLLMCLPRRARWLSTQNNPLSSLDQET